MKYFFSLIIIFLLTLSVNAEDLKITLDTKVKKLNINDTFQVRLTANSEIIKIEKGFLSLVGGDLKNLEKVDEKTFIITLKVKPDAKKISFNVLPEKVEDKQKNKNKEASNKLVIGVSVPAYFGSVFGTSQVTQQKASTQENSNSNQLTSSIFGGLTPLLGLIMKSGFGSGANFNSSQPRSVDSTGGPVFSASQGAVQSVDTVVENTSTTSHPVENPQNKKVDRNSPPTVGPVNRFGNENKIVFVDCANVKDASGVLAGRFVGAQRFDRHSTLGKGASHSYVVSGEKYCFVSNQSYALAFNPLSGGGSSGAYKFILFARKTNIPDGMNGKCAIISPNQARRPSQAIGYLSSGCSGFLNRDYTSELNSKGQVYVLQDGIQLVGQ